MDMKLCRICGKHDDDNYMHIFETAGLQHKIETCLPIVIVDEYPLPDIICNRCSETVESFYCFVRNCIENITVLEEEYRIIESCLKSKRKVNKLVSVSDCELSDVINNQLIQLPAFNTDVIKQTKDETPIPNFSCSLVDYDYSSDSDTDEADTNKAKTDERKPVDTNTDNSGACDIINEIVARKYLKRKSEDIPYNAAKIPRLESDSSSRRKNKQPKKVEYHLGTKLDDVLPVQENYFVHDNLVLPERLLSLPPEISITREVPEVNTIEENLQTCLLCEQQFSGLLMLTSHMYETHGIDLSLVYANNQQPIVEKPAYKNRKIPELVKISDVLGPRRQKSQDYSDEPPVLEPQEKLPSCVTISKSHYTCSECQEMQQQITFPTFRDYSNHRRSQHQIFHCDLCPKFYGRNSHLWKHVNRVHKGHPSITCQRCYKTSASKYHLAQHFNKMHSVKSARPRFASNTTGNTSTPDSPDDDDDLLNQKFQGFDFKSVRQSFLRQELINKQHKYVSILKKKVVENGDEIPNNFARKNINIKKEPDDVREYQSDSEEGEEETKKETKPACKVVKTEEVKSAPKEIDSSSNLYTNIITNYTPPRNEGPYKCPKCFKGFHKKHLVKKHKKNCRPRLQKDLLTRCKTCSRIFKDRQSLAKHLINYHSEYTCEICNVAVQSKCEIVSHIRFSHPNSELTCHCGQILRSKNDLAKHKSDHRDSHVCQFCGDMLPTKIKLKMHILSLHRKILSLSCGICLKLFETQHILKDHVRLIHGDQLTPLTSCTVCGKNYGSKWKTYDHLNKSHGRIFKACKACLEVFETEQDLQRHFDAEHLNSKNFDKKTILVGRNYEEKGSCSPERQDNSQNVQDFNQDEPSSSDSEDEDATSGETSTHTQKPAHDDTDYRNYVIKEFKSSADKKSSPQNGFGKHQDSKNQHDNKLSLLEKRLMGKKITEDDLKATKNHDNKTKTKQESTENINKRQRNLSKDEQEELPSKGNHNDGDILQNSSKRTVYVNSNDPSLCEICLKVWPAKKHLWQHYIRCHKQVAATVCGICLKTNPSYSSLQTHLRETHPNLLHGCGFGSNFICKICGRYHNASSKLKLHMAIHVGFNESILENYADGKENTTDAKQQSESENSESEVETNEITTKTVENNAEQDDDIIYESLIEEVEASSDSDNEDNQTENQENVLSVTSKEELSSSDADESDSDDQISENELTENDMEQEMLKNMIGENSHMKNKNMHLEVKAEVIDSSDVSQEISYESNDYPNLNMKAEPSNDSNTEYDLDSCKLKMEVCDDWMHTSQKQFLQTVKTLSKVNHERLGLFQCKPDELDNAIRSISLDQCENNDNMHNGDFSDMQTTCLNDSELETAVGSIL